MGPVEPGSATTAPEELELDDELEDELLDDELVEYHQDDPEELDELEDELDELDELVENHHWALQVVAVIPVRNRPTIAKMNRFRTDFLSIRLNPPLINNCSLFTGLHFHSSRGYILVAPGTAFLPLNVQ